MRVQGRSPSASRYARSASQRGLRGLAAPEISLSLLFLPASLAKKEEKTWVFRAVALKLMRMAPLHEEFVTGMVPTGGEAQGASWPTRNKNAPKRTQKHAQILTKL